MALAGKGGIQSVSFDLGKRELQAIHRSEPEQVLALLSPLKLGTVLRDSSELPQEATGLHETTFSVSAMDCVSEENIVRLALAEVPGISSLTFNLAKRELKVVHQGEAIRILERLRPLRLGAEMRESHLLASPEGSRTLRSTCSVPKMDCPSEENMIRMAFGDVVGVKSLAFDLPNRKLEVVHESDAQVLLDRLAPLNLGATLKDSAPLSATAQIPTSSSQDDADEARTLRLLLMINGVMFFLELALGLVAQSTGLIADSLDMFADAAVYGLALYAVGKAASLKVRAARVAGWLQLLLALGALAEVMRRFLFGSEPESVLMMGVGVLALAANVTCLVLISKKRDRGAHMTASYIFSANDVIANLGVIAAGVLVALTGSPYPDLIIGTIIGVVVMNGARRILQLR
ncbi:cation transporter [Noviherbaspirillum sp. 17J57-3]|uniref:Cation transporter n=1 Tax=Noviherbaspirillum galbum TaxID=2709383 RepID=A0A6B3SJC5_9BURK|nr:cation transporter [Noviherbaspirillum galbum]